MIVLMLHLLNGEPRMQISMNSRWWLLPFTICMDLSSINLIAVLPCTQKLWKGFYAIVHMGETLVSFELLYLKNSVQYLW